MANVEIENSWFISNHMKYSILLTSFSVELENEMKKLHDMGLWGLIQYKDVILPVKEILCVDKIVIRSSYLQHAIP